MKMFKVSLKRRLFPAILSIATALTLTTGAALTANASTIATPMVTGTVGVTYQSHIQSIGWQKAVTNGGQSGTTERALRLEALKISLTGAPAGTMVSYSTQVQRYGWQPAVSNGTAAGTTGKALRAEAIRITISGLSGYAVQYRAYVQRTGWQAWQTTNNGTALAKAAYTGTVGKALRMEAIQIKIVKLTPTIASAAPVSIATDMGVVPTMPSTVPVTMSDATTQNASVTWDTIDPSQYQYGGTFSVSGSIKGSSTVTATANVRVNSTTVWSDGKYLVGTDVLAGEYVIVSKDDSGAMIEVASDNSGSDESIISGDFSAGRDIYTVTEGQYLTVSNGIMYPLSSAPAIDTSTGTYGDGMYKDGMHKVGTDIPAVQYTITPNGAISIGIYQISKDSLHLDSSTVTSIQVITSSTMVTLTAGQYIQTAACDLKYVDAGSAA